MTISPRPVPAPSFGTPPDRYDGSWFSAFLALLTRRMALLAGPNTIQPQIMLQSPNGTVFVVTVSDTGTLTTTVATRGTVPPPA